MTVRNVTIINGILCMLQVTVTMCLPQPDLRNAILDHIAATEAHFKSQQIGEPELTVAEKRTIADNILNKSASLFLSRFGQYLKNEHFEFFQNCPEEDQYIISHYLKQHQQESKLNKKLVRNRRFEAMNQMIKGGSYFSETEMRSRNPLLYEHLVGQYLTAEEKEISDRPDTSNISFVNLLLHQIDRDSEETLRQEQMEHETKEADEEKMERNTSRVRHPTDDPTVIEYDTSDDEDTKNQTTPRLDSYENVRPSTSLWGEDMTDQPLSTPVGMERTPWATASSRTVNPPAKAASFVQLSDKERRLLFEEFRTHMFTNFLDGKEKQFDYSKVDSNPAYDNLTERGQDAEDEYFNDDESSGEMQVEVDDKSSGDMQLEVDDDTSRDSSDLGDELEQYMNELKPVILMQDINCKMKQL